MSVELHTNFCKNIPKDNTSIDEKKNWSKKLVICLFKNEKENKEDFVSKNKVEIEEKHEISDDTEKSNIWKKKKKNWPSMLDLLRKFEGMTENIIVENKCFKQQNISDFFRDKWGLKKVYIIFNEKFLIACYIKFIIFQL